MTKFGATAKTLENSIEITIPSRKQIQKNETVYDENGIAIVYSTPEVDDDNSDGLAYHLYIHLYGIFSKSNANAQVFQGDNFSHLKYSYYQSLNNNDEHEDTYFHVDFEKGIDPNKPSKIIVDFSDKQVPILNEPYIEMMKKEI